MRGAWADENERVPRTVACFRGVHGDCPHLMSGFGGRFLKIPEGDVLDASVDALTGHYVTAARLIGRSVADLWKFLRPPR
jgi:hypothetical protein